MNIFSKAYFAGLIRNLSEWRFYREKSLTDGDPADEALDRFLLDFPPHGGDLSRLRYPSYWGRDVYSRDMARADWQHVDWRLQLFAGLFIKALKKEQVPFYVHSAFRTSAEQAQLVAKGVSKTPYPKAAHCQGKAIDLVHGRYAWALSNDEWALIGLIGKQVADQLNSKLRSADRFSITWGGDWRFYDPAHWEIADWQSLIHHPTVGNSIRLTNQNLLSNNSHRL